MKTQRRDGIISTINFSPFFDTENCFCLRDELLNEAIVASHISPKNQLNVFNETILVFENLLQALNFLSSILRIAAWKDKYVNSDINLRVSLCRGDYVIDQGQIYGDAVNMATKLSYSSCINELLVCGIEGELIKKFVHTQSDITCFTHNTQNNCYSLELVDGDTTLSAFRDRVFQIDYNRYTESFKSSFKQKISIGRSPQADITIDSDVISRNHATIIIDYEDIFIRDHSANGTYLYFDGREIFLTNDTLQVSSAGHVSCALSMYSCRVPEDVISYHLCDAVN